MSFAKYAQLYRDMGFFSGSKIKATVTDNSFIGQELVLSKGNTVLQTRTIPVTGLVEFFTDASGTLTLSADNGTLQISATVKVTNYATYNVTVKGTATDTSRQIYADDVEMDADPTVANVAYTGDVSAITAVVSDNTLIKATVNGNKITLTDAGNDKQGRCSITATVANTANYDRASVTFNVNKLTGQYGSWADASDDVIASMIAKADAGEIDLADYWNIGDTRRVHLNAIEAGIEVAEQVEQDIDLVIMHNPLGDSAYMLTTPTAGNRYQPHFIIGTKECLENKTALSAFTDTITATYNSTYSISYDSYLMANSSKVSELLEMLNNGFILALPQYLQDKLKPINRLYLCSQSGSINVGADIINYSIKGTKSHKVSLANINELGFTSSIERNGDSTPTGIGVYDRSGKMDDDEKYSPIASRINSAVNDAGTKFSYYTNNSIIKHKGNTSILTDYHVLDTLIAVTRDDWSSSSLNSHFSMAFYIGSNGELTTNNLADSGQRTMLRGISPIMFI